MWFWYNIRFCCLHELMKMHTSQHFIWWTCVFVPYMEKKSLPLKICQWLTRIEISIWWIILWCFAYDGQVLGCLNPDWNWVDNYFHLPWINVFQKLFMEWHVVPPALQWCRDTPSFAYFIEIHLQIHIRFWLLSWQRSDVTFRWNFWVGKIAGWCHNPVSKAGFWRAIATVVLVL